MANEIHPLLG